MRHSSSSNLRWFFRTRGWTSWLMCGCKHAPVCWSSRSPSHSGPPCHRATRTTSGASEPRPLPWPAPAAAPPPPHSDTHMSHTHSTHTPHAHTLHTHTHTHTYTYREQLRCATRCLSLSTSTTSPTHTYARAHAARTYEMMCTPLIVFAASETAIALFICIAKFNCNCKSFALECAC